MTAFTIRYPSKVIQYGFAERVIEVDGSISNSDLGKLYAEAVLQFQAAEIDAYNEVEKQAKAGMISLGGKVVAVEDNPKTEESEPSDEAPWTAPAPAATTKPWETKATPKFNFGN